MLPDKSEMLAVIPGRFRKRCWMKVGDILIVSRREFQATKLDVIHKYNDEETRKLAKDHEIPEFFLQSFVGGDGESRVQVVQFVVVFDNYGFSQDHAWNFYENYMAGKESKKRTGWVNDSDYEPEPLD